MIMGITGYASSGKDTAAEFFKERGFTHLDFYRDILVAELKENGLEVNKMNAALLGKRLREEFGRGAMARMMSSKIEPDGNYVITGIRSPEEAAELKKLGGFYLICIDTPLDIRFMRRKGSDPQDIDSFKKRDDLDLEKGLGEVIGSADITLSNDGTPEELEESLKKMLGKLI